MKADPLLVGSALTLGELQYDPDWGLVLTPARYNPIHTKIVSGSAHLIRDSAAYALALFESGDRARGEHVLRSVLDFQDDNLDSPTYGLWPYWAEEPLDQMDPPDWNWADFIGEFLALVLKRHSPVLTDATREALREGVFHAAASIIRRDVDLDYTNIAMKGTWVTLSAGQLLDDPAISDYGRQRLSRLHKQIVTSRSLAEYNSPRYWHVVLQALTAVRQYIDEAALMPLAEDLLRVVWEHFLARWHPSTGQLTGPMARCYDTDIRKNQGILAVLQRVDPDHWTLLDASTLQPTLIAVHDAVLDYTIPADLKRQLSERAEGAQVTETFDLVHYVDDEPAGVSHTAALGKSALVVPAIGTSWFDGAVTLGSINHGDTWLQRRVLLGFWAEPEDGPVAATTPARSISAVVLHDGRSFASGSFSSVQSEGNLLWTFSLASPGGDEHIHLDTIPAGQALLASELLVRFMIAGLAGVSGQHTVVTVDEERLFAGDSVLGARRVSIRSAGMTLDWSVSTAVFDGADRPVRVTVTEDAVTIDVEWFVAHTPMPLVLRDLNSVNAAGTLQFSGSAANTTAIAHASNSGTAVDLDWSSMSSTGEPVRLTLRAPASVGTRLEHARTFEASKNHKTEHEGIEIRLNP